MRKTFPTLLCVFCFSLTVLSLGSHATAHEMLLLRNNRAFTAINPAEIGNNSFQLSEQGTPGGSAEVSPLPKLGEIRVRPDAQAEGTQDILLERKSPDVNQEVGIPLVFNDAVERYIKYFSTTKKELFERWLKRKRLYEPLVKQILKEYGLPEDLVCLAMIESGFNLQAYSPMKAAGLWQFIPETGKRYGLTVNHWIDERRDVQKSTTAAARYLQELFDQFDSWYLAAAAYNAGENRIDRLIKRHDTRDFWQLSTYNSLPRETREYVPQLIAAAILSKNPEKYGLNDVDSVTPLQFVGQDVPGGVSLATLAKAASADLNLLKMLNPELRTDITPPGKECRIKLPARTDTRRFRRSLASVLKKEKRVIGVIDHLIKGQDDVSKITNGYGVTRDELMMVNDSPFELKQGELVYIPQFSVQKREEEPIPAKAASYKKIRRQGQKRIRIAQDQNETRSERRTRR